jgi:hypothetical protein
MHAYRKRTAACSSWHKQHVQLPHWVYAVSDHVIYRTAHALYHHQLRYLPLLWCALQAADHLSADTPLFHSDMLRPLVVDSMRVAVQELSQCVQQQGGQPGEV